MTGKRQGGSVGDWRGEWPSGLSGRVGVSPFGGRTEESEIESLRPWLLIV